VGWTGTDCLAVSVIQLSLSWASYAMLPGG